MNCALLLCSVLMALLVVGVMGAGITLFIAALNETPATNTNTTTAIPTTSAPELLRTKPVFKHYKAGQSMPAWLFTATPTFNTYYAPVVTVLQSTTVAAKNKTYTPAAANVMDHKSMFVRYKVGRFPDVKPTTTR